MVYFVHPTPEQRFGGKPRRSDHVDMIDLLLQLGILGTFVVFAIAIWLLRKEKLKADAKKKQQDHDDSA